MIPNEYKAPSVPEYRPRYDTHRGKVPNTPYTVCQSVDPAMIAYAEERSRGFEVYSVFIVVDEDGLQTLDEHCACYLSWTEAVETVQVATYSPVSKTRSAGSLTASMVFRKAMFVVAFSALERLRELIDNAWETGLDEHQQRVADGTAGKRPRFKIDVPALRAVLHEYDDRSTKPSGYLRYFIADKVKRAKR